MKADPKLMAEMYANIEQMLTDKGFSAICGVDEVGRGPLAGPVVAAAVIMPPDLKIEGLTDSKKLSPKRREIIFEQIADLELPCAVGIIDNECIDKMNILKASLMAMRKAVQDLQPNPDFLLVDGTFTIPKMTQPQYAIVGGDALCASISAASIVAKVTRDRIMDRYQTLYPSFSFAQHKGYPTRAHLEELREHGPCEIHRRSFKPVAELVDQYVLF
ncbi:MAG TPA: ribonuclease HII [candidate division Zixibacteria bacterium]|nr:ribonuclease HII [candidate division Zixibacteria bacterium]